MWHFEECFSLQIKRTFWFRYKIKKCKGKWITFVTRKHFFLQLSIVVTPWATLILLYRAKNTPSSCYLVVNPQLEICNAIDFHRHVWDYLFFQVSEFHKQPLYLFSLKRRLKLSKIIHKNLFWNTCLSTWYKYLKWANISCRSVSANLSKTTVSLLQIWTTANF